MAWIMVDVEADGPAPGLYSMIQIGAVVVDPDLDKTFYAELHPVSDRYDERALEVVGVTREQTLAYPPAGEGMAKFYNWVKEFGPPIFISDNNGFDWQFVNYYFWQWIGKNPFGFSSTNLGSLYKGMAQDTRKNFKHLRRTKHTHHPVDDAMGNAEALLRMRDEMGLSIRL